MDLGFKVSKDMLRKFLKKLGYTYRRIRKRLKSSPDPIEYAQKVKELQTLIQLEKEKFLTIYYADEAGFSSLTAMDHWFQIEIAGPPENAMLEGYSVLAFAAGLTELLLEGGDQGLDVSQAENLVYTASARIPLLERQTNTLENALSVLLARNPAAIENRRPLGEQQFPSDVPAGLPAELLKRRPEK